jgi:3-methyladenine DNA glycosylase AlkD
MFFRSRHDQGTDCHHVHLRLPIMKPGIAVEISARLRQLGDPEKARFLQRFFKTGPGEYAEGDCFIGLKVPQVRLLLREYRGLTPTDVLPLLMSPIHEERLFALLALVRSFEKGDPATREQVYTFYMANTSRINNWDLVDISAPQIVGGFLLERDRGPLDLLAQSTSLWERRIAIIATFTFIRRNQFDDTLRIGRLLLHDREDLIHKAAGWMLREVGKREQAVEEGFLKLHCRVMPRTMLRYAIEKYPEDKRQMYLKGKF